MLSGKFLVFLYCTHDHHSLTQTFRELDVDGNKGIAYKEFSKVIKNKIGRHYSQPQRKHLFEFVDTDHSGVISLHEFKKAFKVEDAALGKWQGQILDSLSTFVYTNRDHLKQGFQALDTAHSGEVDVEEFKCVLQSAVDLSAKRKALTPNQIHQLATLMTKNEAGLIDWPAFLDGFELIQSQ